MSTSQTRLSAHCVGNSRKGVRGWKTWKIVMECFCENFLEKVGFVPARVHW